MIGPFDCWTTARSEGRAGAAGAGLAAAVGFEGVSCEHPVSSAAAVAVRAVTPHSLRVMATRVSDLGEVGLHVPHGVDAQLPQPLPGLLITWSSFSIVLSPFDWAALGPSRTNFLRRGFSAFRDSAPLPSATDIRG